VAGNFGEREEKDMSDYYEFSKEVSLEIARAEDKFGATRWPITNLSQWAVVLGEEMGEVCQAINEYEFGDWEPDRIRKEAVQVAAMAFKVYEAAEKESA
jgi:NTP pyrophosphatase (non-canonical NTP hydrolase)